MKIKMVATCLFGLESLLGAEIDKLGCKRCETMDGRIYFEGDEHQLAAANIRLRFAERVYINMGEFDAYSFNDLFEYPLHEQYRQTRNDRQRHARKHLTPDRRDLFARSERVE